MLGVECAAMSVIAFPARSVDLKSEDARAQRISPEFQLSVFVIFTSTVGTLKALEKAGELARPLGAGIVVVAAQVVPYPLPLDRPPVPFEFVFRRFGEMVRQIPEKTQILAYLCRDQLEALNQVLDPSFPVLIAIKRRWWPTREQRLARKLRRAGYDVISVETE
jgi:hypothetical protein